MFGRNHYHNRNGNHDNKRSDHDFHHYVPHSVSWLHSEF